MPARPLNAAASMRPCAITIAKDWPSGSRWRVPSGSVTPDTSPGVVRRCGSHACPRGNAAGRQRPSAPADGSAARTRAGHGRQGAAHGLSSTHLNPRPCLIATRFGTRGDVCDSSCHRPVLSGFGALLPVTPSGLRRSRPMVAARCGAGTAGKDISAHDRPRRVTVPSRRCSLPAAGLLRGRAEACPRSDRPGARRHADFSQRRSDLRVRGVVRMPAGFRRDECGILNAVSAGLAACGTGCAVRYQYRTQVPPSSAPCPWRVIRRPRGSSRSLLPIACRICPSWMTMSPSA